MLGVQYSSCCYAIRVGYERKLNGWDNDKQHAVYDNAIGFNIELRGLSSNYGLDRISSRHAKSDSRLIPIWYSYMNP